jgi:hypothetical protein
LGARRLICDHRVVHQLPQLLLGLLLLLDLLKSGDLRGCEHGLGLRDRPAGHDRRSTAGVHSAPSTRPAEKSRDHSAQIAATRTKPWAAAIGRRGTATAA